MGEEEPLISHGEHLQIDKSSTRSCDNSASSTTQPLSPQSASDAVENEAISNGHDDNHKRPGGGATVFQTSINMGKMCMGTGTLALPFAAEKGGLLFNAIGLFLIGLWNYYSANCLLRCLEYLPHIDTVVDRSSHNNLDQMEQQQSEYGTSESNGTKSKISAMPPPPEGTTTYGAVAWYASGPKGLLALELLMLMLFFGLLIAYEVAMMSFIADTPFTTGSRKIDLLIPSTLIALLSCVKDIGFLSKFSGMGLFAVMLSFVVISWQGYQENGFSGYSNAFELNQWPESLSAASSWFGVVVFGYGVVPFVFNFRDSMAVPDQVTQALQIGLFLVYVGYVVISNGVAVLFSPSHIFEGDVLQAMPNTWISLMVRLLMTFVVAVTAPLLVVPFGELVEGKLGIDSTQPSSAHMRIVVRVTFIAVCTVFSEFLGSGFVHVVSFIGCFCVAMTGFVLPPLFCIQLSNQRRSARKDGPGIDSVLICDIGVLVLGITATVISSTLTFRELIMLTELK